MRKLSKIITFGVAFCMTAMAVIQPITALADVPYRTYTQNGYGEMVETQTAYIPQETFIRIESDQEGAVTQLVTPSDLKILKGETDADTYMYIADTGNSRIVVSDLKGNMVREIGKGILKKPNGIFVKEDGTLYVADSDLAQVVVFDVNGNVIEQYGKPNSPLYGENTKFEPLKIAVSGDTMYITSSGNTNGVIQLTPQDGGTFLGYFGTNMTSVTVLQKFQELIFSDDTKSRLTGKLPASVSNLCIDAKGLIYTLTTGGTDFEKLKKLDISGSNLIQVAIPPWNGAAVCTGNYENIYVASSDGYIYEYNKEGSLLFMYGGKDDKTYRVGLFDTVSAIAVDQNDRIYVLDTAAGEIQVFEQTEFTDLVHQSLVLYQKGAYTQSKEPLTEVIRMNGLFDYANQAMGQALYQEEDYKEAMRYFRLAKDKPGYSDAFWEVRNEWLTGNLVTAFLIILAIVIVVKMIKWVDRQTDVFASVHKMTGKVTGKLLYRQLTYGFTYMKHPVDGAYDVKRKNMCSYGASAMIILLLIIFNIVNKYFCGFYVKTQRDGRYDIATDVVSVLFVLLFLTACTYLICTINEGEGRFKEILCGYIYSLTPYMIILPIIYLVGLVVTANEIFIIEFANVIMFTWIAILIFLTIKEINNYSVKETFKVIGLTIFAAFIFALIAFVVYVLAAQVIDFIKSLYGEVVYRIGKS